MSFSGSAAATCQRVEQRFWGRCFLRCLTAGSIGISYIIKLSAVSPVISSSFIVCFLIHPPRTFSDQKEKLFRFSGLGTKNKKTLLGTLFLTLHYGRANRDTMHYQTLCSISRDLVEFHCLFSHTPSKDFQQPERKVVSIFRIKNLILKRRSHGCPLPSP